MPANYSLRIQTLKYQAGMAILMAMLTLSLVSMLAAGLLWQQWRVTELEETSRYEQQASLLLGASLDWARVILSEDAKASNTDNKTEPWSIPLQETQLSTFIAANNTSDSSSAAMDTESILQRGIDDAQAEQIFLSGRITDLQSRLNTFNLLNSGQISKSDLAAFTKLFEILGLPSSELELMIQSVLSTDTQGNPNKSILNSITPVLTPQRTEQLAWLGMKSQTIAALSPYVIWLPTRTSVNLNPAPPQVIAASFDGLTLSNAQKLTQQRDSQPWSSLEAAGNDIRAADSNHSFTTPLSTTQFSLSSNYFQVIGRIRYDSLVFTERSVLQRNNQQTLILWRERRAAGAEPGCFSTIEPPC